MYSLVCFQNSELLVCKSKNVSTVNDTISAKYKKRGSYLAKYAIYDDSKEILESLCNNICKKLPYIILTEEDKLNASIQTFPDSGDPDFIPENSNNSDSGFNFESPQHSLNNSLKADNSVEQHNQSAESSIEHQKEIDVYNYERVSHELVVEELVGTKKYFCLYCEKAVTKLVRHLETVHRSEDNVKKFSVLPKGCMERKKIVETLRKKGCFIYNTNKSLNCGNMIVTRRPRTKKKGYLYKPCPICRGFFSKATLRRHYAKCGKKIVKGERIVMVESRRIHAKLHPIANDILKNEVFPVLREDKISRLLRYDELLILHGNKLSLKFKAKFNHKMIRARLRLLGRLLYEIRKINKEIKDFASIYSPEYYDSFVQAVNVLAQLSSDGSKYKRPAVAFAIGTEIKKVAKLFITSCIKKKNEEAKKLAGYFLELHDEDYGGSVNKTVAESQSESKRNKITNLPIMEDIKRLNMYINKNRLLAYQNLIEHYSFSNWKMLASFTLISLLLLNRRRVGELERTLLTDINNYQTVCEDQNLELYEGFTSKERMAAKKYARISIRGKLSREVPVLIPKQEFQCLKLIMKFRKRAGVAMNNPYVFGLPSELPSQQKYLKACDLLRKYSMNCSAKYPERLRGTLLRKHIATRSAVKGFNENEVSDLANYLGHAEKIHRDNYRMPLPALEITRMSGVLEEARGNKDVDIDESRGTISNLSDLEDSDSNASALSNCSDISDKKPVRRVSWNDAERKTVLKIFSNCFKKEIVPSLPECGDAISKHESLRSRTPMQLKAYIFNQLKRNKRILEQSKEDSDRKKKLEKIRNSF